MDMKDFIRKYMTENDTPAPPLPKQATIVKKVDETALYEQILGGLDQYHKFITQPNLSTVKRASDLELALLRSLWLACQEWLSYRSGHYKTAIKPGEIFDPNNPNLTRHEQKVQELQATIDKAATKIQVMYNSSALQIGGTLGSGNVNPPHKATVTTTSGKKKGVQRDVVWKEDQGNYIGTQGRAWAPSGAGIPGLFPQLSSRAVASSKLDKDLTGVLARTRFGEVNGKIGTVQDFIQGTCLANIASSNRPALYTKPTIIRDLFHLQLIDYITAQVDRHPENILITPADEARGIDHDFSFGSKDIDSLIGNQGIHNKGLPTNVGADVATKVLAYKSSDLEGRLSNLLSPDEVKEAYQRLQKVQNEITSNKITQVPDWTKFTPTPPSGGYFYP